MICVEIPAQLKDKLDTSTKCPMVRSVSVEMLKGFTAISDDQSIIHSTQCAAPTIPGNLLIALMPAMLQSGLTVKIFDQCKTVALDKIRFYHSVSLNEPLQLHYQLLSARTLNNSTFVIAELCLYRVANEKKVLSAQQTDCYISQ